MSGILVFATILGVIVNDKENILSFFEQAGTVALVLKISMLVFGFLSARLMKLHTSQGITISIETGI